MDYEDAELARNVQVERIAHTEAETRNCQRRMRRDLVIFLVCLLAVVAKWPPEFTAYIRFAAIFAGLSFVANTGMWWLYVRRLSALRASTRAW